MTIKRLDHVSVVVKDLRSAIAFCLLALAFIGQIAFPYGVLAEPEVSTELKNLDRAILMELIKLARFNVQY